MKEEHWLKDLGVNGFYSLTEEEKQMIFDWIDRRLVKSKYFNYRLSAYVLKNRFRQDGGFFITTHILKTAMELKGYATRPATTMSEMMLKGNDEVENYVFTVARYLKKDKKQEA